MDVNKEPGRDVSGKKSLEDDEIIDLFTEATDPAGDEKDIVELSEVIEDTPPALAAEDDLVDLTDTLEPLQAEALAFEEAPAAGLTEATPSTEDPTIEALDLQPEPEEVLELEEVTTDVGEPLTDDIEFIDLTEETEAVDTRGAAFERPPDDKEMLIGSEDLEDNTPTLDELALEDFDTEMDLEEDLDELLAMDLDSDREAPPGAVVPAEEVAAAEEVLDFGLDLVETPGADAAARGFQTIETTTDIGDAGLLSIPGAQEDTGQSAAVPEDPVVSQTQLEQALERVVQRMFSEKIETILVEVVEKTVQREIGRLNSLLEDATGNGKQ